jgi:hypothetical protein
MMIMVAQFVTRIVIMRGSAWLMIDVPGDVPSWLPSRPPGDPAKDIDHGVGELATKAHARMSGSLRTTLG